MKSLAKLLLPLTGLTREILEVYTPIITDIGFKYKRDKAKRNKYMIYIRVGSNLQFIKYLKEELNLIKIFEEDDNKWVVGLECIEEFEEDWSHFLTGKYSKISLNTRNKIMEELGTEVRDYWLRVMRKNKNDIIDHIKESLDQTKRTPLERKREAKEMYEESKSLFDNQELHKKPTLNVI
jgi:hypothetical protein